MSVNNEIAVELAKNFEYLFENAFVIKACCDGSGTIADLAIAAIKVGSAFNEFDDDRALAEVKSHVEGISNILNKIRGRSELAKEKTLIGEASSVEKDSFSNLIMAVDEIVRLSGANIADGIPVASITTNHNHFRTR